MGYETKINQTKYNQTKINRGRNPTNCSIKSRDLRQEDPLSPYLFLLCTEGLTALLANAEENGNISGVKVCRDAPSISNLLFADDSLILIKANAMNAEALKSILDSYCVASGQMVSVEKSSIFFSPNTKVEDKAQICTILNIMTEALNDKYLSLPVNVGMDKSEAMLGSEELFLV